jgi:hypothetical protein
MEAAVAERHEVLLLHPAILSGELGQVAEKLERLGLTSASVLVTGMSCTTAFTASSTIFPFLVRGMSATCTILAGTCRGEACFLMSARMRFSSCVIERLPSFIFTNRTTRVSDCQIWPIATASSTSAMRSTTR